MRVLKEMPPDAYFISNATIDLGVIGILGLVLVALVNLKEYGYASAIGVLLILATLFAGPTLPQEYDEET